MLNYIEISVGRCTRRKKFSFFMADVSEDTEQHIFYCCFFIVSTSVVMYVCVYIYIYTGCPRRNVKYFGRVFLMLNYTDITQNT